MTAALTLACDTPPLTRDRLTRPIYFNDLGATPLPEHSLISLAFA